MGRSAKMHKRITSKKSRQASRQQQLPVSKPQASASVPQPVIQGKRKSKLKAKTQGANSSSQRPSSSRTRDEPVLGGVDYVALMMGGRRKAREETNKMVEDQE